MAGMAYYPPAGSHQTIVYPGTPVAPSNYLSPQQQLAPNVIYVPSSPSSRSSRHDDRDRRHSRRHSDSHGRSHSSSHKHGHRRHESDGHHRHRSSSHHRRDRSPQVVMVHPQTSPVVVAPNGYQYYRPTWTQRLRQFFGLAPNYNNYNTHSSGFFGRSRRRYDPYTGAELDRYGQPIYRR
ncbi:hypothetical protein AX14_005737 [Amanita brunnescens Koide BX004]|nr:hypothetical protein AX14_005737 [Amanita brunnescens Koide BX004]